MIAVALSGGKDSTAMALAMADRGEPVDHYIITPTGDELSEMVDHWRLLEGLLGREMTRLGKTTLDDLIDHFGALPNWRQRWCTRMLKIQPCLAWIHAQPERVTLCVGLRADEPERRGIYDADVDTRFPLREWGWGLADVRDYLLCRGVEIPRRTDCARCYGQRVREWYELWRRHPDIYTSAEAQEQATGHTFRSPGRDTWPPRLSDLRRRFESGHEPRKPPTHDGAMQLPLLHGADEVPEKCRVCSL